MADGSIKIDTKLDTKGAEQGIKDLQKNLNGAADKLKGTGKKMSAAITAPIVGLGTVAFAAADQVDQAYGAIQTGTGATGDALDSLKQSFDEVFTSVPDSAEQVAGSLSNLNTYTNATGEVLEGLTENVLDASRSLGEDGVANSEAFAKAMGQWQIPAEEGQIALDKLFVATQDYGVGLGEISSHLTEYGSVLQNAGFSMEESADLFARLEHNGISVSRVMPGLNSGFRKWAAEGKNSQEELQNVIDAMRNAENETEALTIAQEAFGAEGAQRLQTAIRNDALPSLDDLGSAFENAEGAVEENNAATQTFGEDFREVMNEMAMALQPLGEILLDLAKNALEPLTEGIQRLAEWFQNLSPLAQKIIVLVGGIAAAIGPLLVVVGSLISAFTTVLPVLAAIGKGLMLLLNPIPMIIAGVVALGLIIYDNWELIKETTITVFTAIGEFLSESWTWIKETATEVWTAIAEFFSELWEGIKETFTNVVTTISEWLSEKWTAMQEKTTEIFTAISEFFSDTWNGIKDTVTDIVAGIVEFFSDRWETAKKTTESIFSSIRNILESVWSGIKRTVTGAINNVKDTVSDVWGTIKRISSNVWNGIGDILSGIWDGLKDGVSRAFNTIKDTISGVWDDVRGTTDRIWDGITGSIKGAINGVIGAINGMIGALNGLNIRLPRIPDWVPGIGGRGGGSISFPNIPRIPSLDVGTNLVTQDGLAMIHAGEAIVPAEHAGPYREGEGKQIVIENVMNVDGEELYRIQEPYIDSSMSDKVTIESYMRGERR